MREWVWAESGGLFGVGLVESRIREKGGSVDIEFYQQRIVGEDRSQPITTDRMQKLKNCRSF